MTTAPHIRPVPADLPVYPIGAQDRLDGIALTPDRTSAPWWQDAAARADAILLTRGKVKFLRPDGSVGAMPGAGVTLWAAGDRAVKALYRDASLGTVWRCVAGRRLEGAE